LQKTVGGQYTYLLPFVNHNGTYGAFVILANSNTQATWTGDSLLTDTFANTPKIDGLFTLTTDSVTFNGTSWTVGGVAAQVVSKDPPQSVYDITGSVTTTSDFMTTTATKSLAINIAVVTQRSTGYSNANIKINNIVTPSGTIAIEGTTVSNGSTIHGPFTLSNSGTLSVSKAITLSQLGTYSFDLQFVDSSDNVIDTASVSTSVI
jgi:hypothetical protein